MPVEIPVPLWGYARKFFGLTSDTKLSDRVHILMHGLTDEILAEPDKLRRVSRFNISFTFLHNQGKLDRMARAVAFPSVADKKEAPGTIEYAYPAGSPFGRIGVSEKQKQFIHASVFSDELFGPKLPGIRVRKLLFRLKKDTPLGTIINFAWFWLDVSFTATVKVVANDGE